MRRETYTPGYDRIAESSMPGVHLNRMARSLFRICRKVSQCWTVDAGLEQSHRELQSGLTAILKSLPLAGEKRDEYEGRLYVALTHLDHHVKPAIKEWDRVVDRMPND